MLPTGTRDERADAYPMPRVPTGWYALLPSRELRPGTIANLHYFGKDLVAFRDAQGRASVLDAFCPHYGAHLGVGGRIVDGEIECPFHGWRFGGDGHCTRAPFVDRPPRASTGSYSVVEHEGFVFVWSGSGEPAWSMPRIPVADADGFGAPIVRIYRSRTHIQEMRENVVDESHFHHIHGQDRPSEPRFSSDGPRGFVRSELRKSVGGFLVDATFDAEMIGPGVMVVRTAHTHFDFIAIAMTTPVDETTSELRMTYFFRTKTLGRWAHPILRVLFAAISDPEVETEIAIWDRKRFLDRPIFLPHERGIRVLRRWYAQFYASAATANPMDSGEFGLASESGS